MDRSFLLQPDVIAASRHFVCIRLATYENAEEAAYLKTFGATRSGDVENSIFCILGPDGKERLSRPARSPWHGYNSASALAQALDRIARERPGKPAAGARPELPLVATVRLALNIAACDNQPLIVIVAKDPARRKQMEEAMAAVAWSDAFLGRFVYVSTGDPADLANVEGVQPCDGVLIVQHDQYGLNGKVLAQLAASAVPEETTKALGRAIEQYHPYAKSFGNHVRAGQQQGIFWETKIPVSDPMERNARERGKRKAGME